MELREARQLEVAEDQELRVEHGPELERSLVAVRALGSPAPGAATERGVHAPGAARAGRPLAPEVFATPGTPK
eukprot:11593119-Alexandrium_andersonii.AAC.1